MGPPGILILDERNSNSIPAADFAQLLDQYEHRLLSMEADLKDRAKTENFPAKAFERRIKKIREINIQISGLKAISKSRSNSNQTTMDIGFPILEDCTSAEQEVCDRFMAEREKHIKELEKESRIVLNHLQKTIHGNANGIQITFWLSKLRVQIKNLEKLSLSAEQDCVELDSQIEQFIKSMKGSSVLVKNKDTIGALITIFNKLEATISRVAKLRASLKREEKKSGKFIAWLNTQENILNGKIQTIPPPSPMETAKAARKMRTKVENDYVKIKQNVQLATQFWDDVVKHGAEKALNSTGYSPSERPRPSPTIKTFIK